MEAHRLTAINSMPYEVKNLVGLAENVRVYAPDGAPNAWNYSHHAAITSFKGKLYVFYSNGRKNEDDCGQRVVMAVSDDFYHWENRVIADSIPGGNDLWFLTCSGCHVYGGKMVVYCSARTHDPDTIIRAADGTPYHIDTPDYRLSYCGMFYTETEDGEHWSPLAELPCKVAGPAGAGTNLTLPQAPLATSTGTYDVTAGNLPPLLTKEQVLIWPGNIGAAYSTDPSGLGEWHGFATRVHPKFPAPPLLCEGSVYQEPNGALVMLFRTNSPRLYGTISYDLGKTWTDLYKTNFNDASARFQMGTLPDGRSFYIGNYNPSRAEIILMASRNGIDFDQWYYIRNEGNCYTLKAPGMHKGGLFGYPAVCFDQEYMYVAYSLLKEAVEVTRIKLTDIADTSLL